MISKEEEEYNIKYMMGSLIMYKEFEAEPVYIDPNENCCKREY